MICKLKIVEVSKDLNQNEKLKEFLIDLKQSFNFDFIFEKGVFIIDLQDCNRSEFNYEIFLVLKRIVCKKYVYLNLENDL